MQWNACTDTKKNIWENVHTNIFRSDQRIIQNWKTSIVSSPEASTTVKFTNAKTSYKTKKKIDMKSYGFSVWKKKNNKNNKRQATRIQNNKQTPNELNKTLFCRPHSFPKSNRMANGYRMIGCLVGLRVCKSVHLLCFVFFSPFQKIMKKKRNNNNNTERIEKCVYKFLVHERN